MPAACAGEAAGRSRSNPSADEADGGEGAEGNGAQRRARAPAAAEAQRQVQATEALRRDLREAELKIESLAEKCAGLEALVAELKDSNAHLVRLNEDALERNKELCRLLLAKEG